MLLTMGLVAASPSGQNDLPLMLSQMSSKQIDVFLAAVSMFEAVQDFGEPVGSFATGSAFATRFVAIELGHAQHSINDAGVFVHDHDAAGASIEPAAAMASKSSGVSSLSAPSMGVEEPPGMMALSCFIIQDAAAVLLVVDERAQAACPAAIRSCPAS